MATPLRVVTNRINPAVEAKDESDGACHERHYSVNELADLWNVSKQTIRRIFQDEPGVLKIGIATATRKRDYLTLRIPESIVKRVHLRLSKSA